MRSFTKNINSIEKILVAGIGFSAVCVFMFYGYFVNATIVNIVERKSAEYEMSEMIGRISDLEAEYAALRYRITHDYAYSLGYSEPERQIFVSEGEVAQNISGAF